MSVQNHKSEIEYLLDQIRRKFLIRNFQITLLVLTVFFVYFSFFQKLSQHLLNVFVLILVYLSGYIFYYYKKISTKFVSRGVLTGIYLVAIRTFFVSGGVKAPIVFWIPVFVFFTLLFLSRKEAIYWFIIGVLTVSIAFIFQITGYDFPQLQNEELRHTLHYVHFMLLMVYSISLSVLGFKIFTTYEEEKTNYVEKYHHENRLVAIGEMAAGVAHEINNPLSISSGYLRSLSRYVEKKSYSDEKIEYYLDKIKQANLRIQNIVKFTGQLSRKNDEDQSKQVNLIEVVEEVVELTKKHFLTEFGVEIEMNLPDGELYAKGNKTKYFQILINLFNNAKDALVDSKTKKISVDLFIEKNKKIILVSDSGPGIRPELVEQLFNPFFTTKAPGKGTGLGLSIVHRLVEDMNGVITIESKVGQGTSFRIELS